MQNIAVVGASGHAKVIIDILRQLNGIQVLGCIDKTAGQTAHSDAGLTLLGGEDNVPALLEKFHIDGMVFAIGDNYRRAQSVAKLSQLNRGLNSPVAIHPAACVAEDVSVGEGSVIMAGAVVNPGCRIGRFCIVNTHASLDHDSTMEDFSSLAPGVCTGGACYLETYAAVNIGAVLVQGIRIGRHSVIGAGSLVLQSVPSHVLAYGRPSRIIRSRAEGERYF